MPARTLTIVLSLTLLLGIGIVAFVLWANVLPAPTNPPTVEFRSVEPGDSVSVAANVSGDHVTRAELWAENQLVAEEANPNPGLSGSWTVAWQWTPAASGLFPLAVRAYDDAGRYGASSIFDVVIPPRGRLAFSSNRSGKYALYGITTNTRETALLGNSQSQDRQPSVSASNILAYTSNRSGGWHILTRALDGASATDLTPKLQSAQHPVWSADSQRLAYEVTISNTTNIYVSDAHGQNAVQVTHGDGYDGQATFSPRGDRIAFAVQQGSRWDVYTAPVDGSSPTRLTNDQAQDWQPAWSPDGNRIAFASNRSGISQIYLMIAPGNGETTRSVRLTNFPSGAEQPTWSPDGNWLAFVAYTGDAQAENRRELYLLFVPKDRLLAEGQGLIRLTQNAFDDTEPTWIGQ